MVYLYHVQSIVGIGRRWDGKRWWGERLETIELTEEKAKELKDLGLAVGRAELSPAAEQRHWEDNLEQAKKDVVVAKNFYDEKLDRVKVIESHLKQMKKA